MNAPVWLLTLSGGVLADRADRRRVIAFFQSIQMLCPALIVVLVMTSSARPVFIIVLSLVVGITDALSMPTFQSIVPSIVERKQISRGIALNSTQFNRSCILGPGDRRRAHGQRRRGRPLRAKRKRPTFRSSALRWGYSRAALRSLLSTTRSIDAIRLPVCERLQARPTFEGRCSPCSRPACIAPHSSRSFPCS